MAHWVHRTGLILCLALTACGTRLPDPVLPPSTAAPTTQATTGSLFGDWESASGDAMLVYRFTDDGRFRFAGVMIQRRGKDVAKITHAETGGLEVRDSVLVLRPDSAKLSRADPEDPAGDYTDVPKPLVVKQFRWRLTATELVLVDENGVESTFRRP